MSQQSDLVDTLVEFLRALGEPIHYKELTNTIIEYGLWKPYGKQPDQIVYSAMHQDVKKRKDYSAFKFMGAGVFVFSDVPGAQYIDEPTIRDNAKPKDIARRSGDLPQETERRRKALSEDARCGNCSHIEYSGVEEYRHSRGLCNGWETSGRCSTSPSALPCPAWQMRTIAQRDADTEKQFLLRITLIKTGYVTPMGMGVKR